MANTWQAIVSNVIQDPDAVVIEMTYTDNVSKIQKEYRIASFDLKSFKQTVQNQLTALTNTTTAAPNLVVGPFDPSPSPLSPADQAQLDYANAIILLGRMNRAIAAGAKTDQDADYIALQGTVKNNFKSSYIDLF